jgi:hypothetical protein
MFSAAAMGPAYHAVEDDELDQAPKKYHPHGGGEKSNPQVKSNGGEAKRQVKAQRRAGL